MHTHPMNPAPRITVTRDEARTYDHPAARAVSLRWRATITDAPTLDPRSIAAYLEGSLGYSADVGGPCMLGVRAHRDGAGAIVVTVDILRLYPTCEPLPRDPWAAWVMSTRGLGERVAGGVHTAAFIRAELEGGAQ